MTYVTYGYGKNSYNYDSITVYGLGLKPIGAVSAALILGINVDYEALVQADKETTLLFSTDLNINIVNKLLSNPELTFVTNMDLNTINQLASNPDILFDMDLLVNLDKELIANKSINFDTELDQTIITFLDKFVIQPLNIYLIPEEIRTLKLFTELRKVYVSSSERHINVKFEDRKIIVPPKLGNEE